MQISCFCLTVLFIVNEMAYGAPLTQKHENAQRFKRQFDFDPIFNPSGGDFNLNNFARPQSRRPGPGEPLIFSNGRRPQATSPTTVTTASPRPSSDQQNKNNNNNTEANIVFINNRPMIATITPFTAPTIASPQFLNCFGNCPTTSEYNPICASNQQQYQNPQKFDCARRCGAALLCACLIHLINGLPQGHGNNGGWQQWGRSIPNVTNNNNLQRNNGTRQSGGGNYQPRSDGWNQWNSNSKVFVNPNNTNNNLQRNNGLPQTVGSNYPPRNDGWEQWRRGNSNISNNNNNLPRNNGLPQTAGSNYPPRIDGWEQWRRGNSNISNNNNNLPRNNGLPQTAGSNYPPRNGGWEQWRRGNSNISNNNNNLPRNNGLPQTAGSNYQPRTNGSNFGWLPNGSSHPYFQVPGGPSSVGGNRINNFTNGGQNAPQPNLGWLNPLNPASNGIGGRSASNVPPSWNPGSTVFGFAGSAPLAPIGGVASKPVSSQNFNGGPDTGNAPLAPLNGGGSWNPNGQQAGSNRYAGALRPAPSNYPGNSNPYANLFIV